MDASRDESGYSLRPGGPDSTWPIVGTIISQSVEREKGMLQIVTEDLSGKIQGYFSVPNARITV